MLLINGEAETDDLLPDVDELAIVGGIKEAKTREGYVPANYLSSLVVIRG